MNREHIAIEGRRIGPGEPPFVIAEVSANHNGDLERAKEIISMAHERGADAVKLQTYTPDTMTIDCDEAPFQIKEGLWKGYNLYDLYSWAQTPFEWQSELFAYARSLGLTVFSTPFDETAVNLLESLNAPAYKIASFEIVDLPLIARVARTGRPMIMSTGMASDPEIQEALECARDNGGDEIALLHCISAYPAPIEEANLRTIPAMAERFGVPIGLSDHTLGTTAAVAGVALGAGLLEKHVIMDRNDGGPDAPFSLEPQEFGELTERVREAWVALGNPRSGRSRSEESSVVFRRSVFAVRDIAEGEAFTRDNVRVIRPGNGLAPRYYEQVLEDHATRALRRGEPLGASDVTSLKGDGLSMEHDDEAR